MVKARLSVRVATVLLAMCLSITAPSAAWSWGGNDPTPDNPVPTTDPTDSGGTAIANVGNCAVVASPSYLGVSCGTGKSGQVIVKKVLGDDPVPTCWHEPVSAEELAAFGYGETPGAAWYWEWCVTGITKEPNRFDPEFQVGLVAIRDGQPVTTLTVNQTDLIDFARGADVMPFPIAVVSPISHPRVGAWVSYFNGTDDEVTVQTGGITLRAQVDSIRVEPYGEGAGDAVTCAGSGFHARRGDTPATAPGCWVKYDRSSAAEPDNQFWVWISAHWVVDISTDGGANWTRFNEFDKAQNTIVPVTEIQTLVVS